MTLSYGGDDNHRPLTCVASPQVTTLASTYGIRKRLLPILRRNTGEASELRQYLTQVRSEVGARLLDRVFDMSNDGKPSKWWTCFARRKFLKSELKK